MKPRQWVRKYRDYTLYKQEMSETGGQSCKLRKDVIWAQPQEGVKKYSTDTRDTNGKDAIHAIISG